MYVLLRVWDPGDPQTETLPTREMGWWGGYLAELGPSSNFSTFTASCLAIASAAPIGSTRAGATMGHGGISSASVTSAASSTTRAGHGKPGVTRSPISSCVRGRTRIGNLLAVFAGVAVLADQPAYSGEQEPSTTAIRPKAIIEQRTRAAATKYGMDFDFFWTQMNC
jgi:hypothetical protein